MTLQEITPKLSVHFLPSMAGDIRGDVVVIDALRATTTIATALSAGAKEIYPCQSVDEAMSLAQRLRCEDPAHKVLLGGERKGVKIAGFDLGNSPLEYTAETVAGAIIVFTTTNGTKALSVCEKAHRVFLAGLVNASAVGHVISNSAEIHIVCAGADGEITLEDSAVAGVICRNIWEYRRRHHSMRIVLNDEALLVMTAAAQALGWSHKEWIECFENSRGGKNLLELGYQKDIAYAAQIDVLQNTPQYLIGERRIVSFTPTTF
jgi:2-phosphosulfolactate phosphatase